MGEIADVAKSTDSMPEKAKKAASIVVDKAVTKAKKESGSTASAVKSFIAGISPKWRKEVDFRWFWRDLRCLGWTSV